jgi:hypothetical protein
MMRRDAARVIATILSLYGLAACGAATTGSTVTTAEVAPPRPYAVALRLEEAEEDAEGTPHTRVSLVRITPEGVRTVETLATEVGACYHQPRPGALMAARCWWAGVGSDYEVRRSGDAIVATRTEVDEETGAGAPSEVARLEVPSDAEVQVVDGR